MADNTLKIEDRQPIIPLSLENLDLSRVKEFVMDYANNAAYIKSADGTLFNISESEASLESIKQYLKNNPDLILNVTIKTDDTNGEERTIQEGIDYVYTLIDKFSKKFKYAGSSVDGGPANSADKVNHSVIIKESLEVTSSFNGEESKKTDITNIGLFKKSGGYIAGPMIPKGKFLLRKDASYGFTLPETGVEGQLFILLKKDV